MEKFSLVPQRNWPLMLEHRTAATSSPRFQVSTPPTGNRAPEGKLEFLSGLKTLNAESCDNRFKRAPCVHETHYCLFLYLNQRLNCAFFLFVNFCSPNRIICGLTQFTNRSHLAFAALEAVCFQTREVPCTRIEIIILLSLVMNTCTVQLRTLIWEESVKWLVIHICASDPGCDE